MTWWQTIIVLLAVLTVVFSGLTLKWLRDNPVLPLDYRRHEMNWTKPNPYALPPQTFMGVMAMTASIGIPSSSAVGYVPWEKA